MSKSYKDMNNKQPKKNNATKVLRIQHEKNEANKDINKYVGMSFTMISKNNED